MTNEYDELTMRLMAGMDNFRQLTDEEMRFRRPFFTNIHKVQLGSHLFIWDAGAWFILKPRFYGELSKSRLQVNVIVQKFLEYQEPIDISQDFLDGALKKTCNQYVFIAFVVMKRISEKFSNGKTVDFNENDTEMYDSLCKHFETLSPTYNFQEQFNDYVDSVFDILKNIIAKVAIKSSLQGIAYSYGIEFELDSKDKTELSLESVHPQIVLCDMSADEFNELIQVFSLPKTKVVYDWLKKSKVPGIQIFSMLLAAILKSNVEDFLKVLNMENKSAREKIDEIKCNLSQRFPPTTGCS